MSGQRGQIELELHSSLLEPEVVVALHVDIALGVSEQRIQAARLDAPEQRAEVRRRAEVAGLHEQVVAVGAYGQQVAAFQPRLEEPVEHVLGGQMQLHRSGILRQQLRETLPQRSGGVRNVLHDMGREPDFGRPEPFVLRQHRQRLVHGPDAVVDSGEHMAVPVHEPLRDPRRLLRLLFSERPHKLLFAVVVVRAVGIAVVVAVLVAVAITVAAFAGVGAVEHQGHVLEALLVVVALQHRQHVALQQSRAHHEQGAVHHPLYDLRVGHHLHGRAVDEDIVILLPQRGYQFGEPRLGQQLRGVRRHGAHRQQPQALGVGHVHDQRLHVVAALRQIVADTLGGRTHVGRERSLAQVAVDRQHPLALEREAGCRVRGEEGLAAAHVERGEEADAAGLAVVARVHDELQVGPEHPERLVDHVPAALVYDYALRLLRLGLLLAAAQPVDGRELVACLALARVGEGYLPCERQGEVLEVLASAHLGVGALQQVDHCYGYQQSQHECRHQYPALAGRRGDHGAHRRRDNSGVVGGESLGEFVLLALLEQEEVERLLDLLLALH